MPLATQGILENVQLVNEQYTVLFPYLREVFINETPVITRLPWLDAIGTTYQIVSYDVRPRTYTLNAAFTASAGSTTLGLTDTTQLLVGDVLEVTDTGNTGAVERVEIVSIQSATSATMVRQREGTALIANTAAGVAASLVVTLIGNSRTGSEINQLGKRAVRIETPQYVQTFQFPVQVGGLANAVENTRLPAGIPDVFTHEQKIAFTEAMRDMEYSSYYGLGEAPTTQGTRGKQKGMKTQIKAYAAGLNYKTGAGGSYTFLNFVADGIQKCIDGGGDPDTVVCSTSFLTGLQTWGFNKQQVNQPRQTSIGLPVSEMLVPFASRNITFVPSYQIKAGTACVLTSADAKMRRIRELFWQKRGINGDAIEGDIIGDACVELSHPGWHSWVEGITGFA